MVNPLARLVACVFLIALGVVTGAVSVLSHAVIISVAGTGWPIGIVLALAGTGGLFIFGAQLLRSRVGAVLPFAGWLLAVLALATTTPTGSQVLPAEPLGQAILSYVLVFGGAALGLVAASLPTQRPVPPPAPAEPSERESPSKASGA